MEPPTEVATEVATEEKEYGWFSAKKKEMSIKDYFMRSKNRIPISSIYLNEKGEEVEVNNVTSGPDHGTKWDDMEYRGIVTKYVRGLYPISPHIKQLVGNRVLTVGRMAIEPELKLKF